MRAIVLVVLIPCVALCQTANDLRIQQMQLQQQQEEMARQLKRQNDELKKQSEETARQLRKLQNVNKPKDTSFHWLPSPPDESWVTDKYLKSYTNAWFYVCQNYPLLDGKTYVRGFFDAELDRARQDPNWILRTVDYAWLRRFAEEFAVKWGVPKAVDLKPDTARYREYAQRGTPQIRAFLESTKKVHEKKG
ncbi:MAG: hypothetical protein H7343_01705 [Undibacterium sp.]|nr:hypothetical protein [Opitutaceae bacterium]